MANQFTWIPLYQELADELSKWQNRQEELIAFLEGLRANGYIITSFLDKAEDESRFPLKEVDPFTFFGVFNRGIRDEHRLAILGQIKKRFNLHSPLPEDFDGIPVLNNQSSWFFSFQNKRKAGDVERLWRVFQMALKDSPLENPEFLKAFDEALTVRKTNINITFGLFWIRPGEFLNLDQNNRAYLKIKLPPGGLTGKFYAETIQNVRKSGKTFPEISHAAWNDSDEQGSKKGDDAKEADKRMLDDRNYWLVGAYWDSMDPADQTDRFLKEGIWENGYTDRFCEEVKSIKVGDKIAIKASGTQHRNLPFNANNKTVSRMMIKAIGTVVANRGDGKTVEVEWELNFKEKVWYFYTSRMTLWPLRLDKGYKLLDLSEKLRDFIWYGKEQEYDWWVNRWGIFGDDNGKSIDPDSENAVHTPYDIEDLMASGIFLTEQELSEILERLRSKKAMILQGPPGVGKTFIARKLAYALMTEVDPSRLEMVQFHQAYSYDDFVRGFRPAAGQAGSFVLQNGVFYDFCQKAINDPDPTNEYVFIIDEINRGNLSQIFGELLMLIEHDKRSPEFAVPLLYRTEHEPRFYIPPNLYLIGLMNVADRSLAMVDYALRRRFAFVTLKPQFENSLYRQWLVDRKMNPGLITLIIERMTDLNKDITTDPLLGENYQVGHSFFCPKGDNFAGLDRNWYNGIVRTEIAPLLKEYWFDNQAKADEVERRLLA